MSTVTVEARDGGVRFPVRVQPRASRTEIAGVQQGALKVRLQAPPVDGAANEALVEFLSDTLDVPRRMIRIVAGDTSTIDASCTCVRRRAASAWLRRSF